MAYNFSQLNDKEFEIFSCDLLGAFFGTRIERFKPGRDSGVDGRYFSNDGNEVILQCKHYQKTGYKGLIRKLKSEEKQKVKILNPKKYLFITSLALSRDNKKEIKSIFSPYIQRDDDVFGQDDLNQLLDKYTELEEKHFKLWISSTAVFNRLINNAIKGRSEYEIEQIQKKSHRFVQTDSYNDAINILKSNNVVIISGEPGIGKTTLAENICLYFSSREYEFVDIEDSLSDAESIYSRGKKQIYYFDDFLGSNYFEAITNKKDSHIIKFIERIRNDKTKLFVLTSRTSILNSGVLHSSSFYNHNIQRDEYLLTIKSLSRMDRARILYNHIWFSELPESFIDEIYHNKRYLNIIDHHNYNPRLIEFITDHRRVVESDSETYWEYIEKMLHNPKEIWRNCFKVQNNAYVRNLVSLTVFNGGSISEKDLSLSFDRLTSVELLKNTSHTEKDFQSTSQLATKSFLRRELRGDDVIYSLFNPSISDFVLNEYSQDLDKLLSVFTSLRTLESLKQLRSLENDNIVSENNIAKLKYAIFESALVGDASYDYQIIAAENLHFDESKLEDSLKIVYRIIKHPKPIEELSKLLVIIKRNSKLLLLKDYGFIYELISNRYLDDDEIKDLAEFIEIYDIDNTDVVHELKVSLEMLISEELRSRTSEIDLSGIVNFELDAYGEPSLSYDGNEIESELFFMATSVLDDYQSDVFRNLDIDIDSVVSEVDIDDLVNEYISSQVEPDENVYLGQISSNDQGIEDLFERNN